MPGVNVEFDENDNPQKPIDVEPNSGLTVEDNGLLHILGTKFNTTMGDLVMSASTWTALARPASWWKGKNLVQVIDELLFPDTLPTYVNPTIVLTATSIGLQEVGVSVNVPLQIRAIKNDAGFFTQLRITRNGTQIYAGLPTAVDHTNVPDLFGYVNPNNPNFSWTHNITDTVVLPHGTQNWVGAGDYLAGSSKVNNKGMLDTRVPAIRSVNAPQAAANGFASNGFSVTAEYPYFWGVSNTPLTSAQIVAIIEAGGGNKVLANANGTLTINFNASGQYLWFAHWNNHTTKTKWYVTALNNGDIGGPSNLFKTVESLNVISPLGLWTAPYKIYCSNYATSVNVSMELRNT